MQKRGMKLKTLEGQASRGGEYSEITKPKPTGNIARVATGRLEVRDWEATQPRCPKGSRKSPRFLQPYGAQRLRTAWKQVRCAERRPLDENPPLCHEVQESKLTLPSSSSVRILLNPTFFGQQLWALKRREPRWIVLE